ncbi:odorant receptor 43a-like [Venturia canescens]|uniref:odorant receptor 43a-like n=1 Tax=Venturia canescens TaxID=32260 RepID=UPI001C9BF79B|nr:odorant receptor 43a-like [Venturia canescens]
MVRQVSLEEAFNFTRLSVRLVCTWPPSTTATKSKIIQENVAWWISFLSVFCLLIPLLASIQKYYSDPIVLTQTMCFCSACATIIMKTLVLRINRDECQYMISEMEEFVKTCESHERRVLQSYVDKLWMFHGIISFMNYLASVPVIFGPFVFPDQAMPTAAIYPFSIESGVLMYLVFIHQSIVGLQTSAALTIDCQMAVIMWFAGARLEILAQEISDSPNVKEFRSFVKKHQRLVAYAERVSGTMCYTALITTVVSGVASIMCCMQFVGNQPLMVQMQFGPVTIVGLTNLMICTWPAENMIKVCNLIGTAVYNAPWFDMSPEQTKDIVMILQRSQQPVQVSIGGFLPALSFRFYSSFLSTVFSYFTTLRLVMSGDEK